MQDRIIVSYKIREERWSNVIIAKFNDGSTEILFSYYPDEISFDETELIGLTAPEAERVRHKKDVAYLRS